MADGAKVTAEDLQLDGPELAHVGDTLRHAREMTERELIHRTLEKTQGNVTRAASELGVSRPTLHQLISRYSLKRS